MTENEIIQHLGQAGQAPSSFPSLQNTPALSAPPPIYPTTSTEFVNVMAHYYRGEMARMAGWRDRIDRTTNWAITVVAALLSVSLSTPTAHHGVLIFAMLLVTLLLVIEARRYRFFHVYRNRVRLIERNYFAAIFTGSNFIEADWTRELAQSLHLPQFSISLQQAMARRLRRNYCWIFLLLLLAWTLKTTTEVLQPKAGQAEFIHSTGEFFQNASVGALPGWLVLAGVLTFYVWLGYVVIKYRSAEGELNYNAVHV